MTKQNPTLKYFARAILDKKGQLIIPKQFRRDLGLGTGAAFAVLRMGDGLILLPQQQRLEKLREQLRARLTAAGATSDELLCTLPKARERVFARHYGKKASSSVGCCQA